MGTKYSHLEMVLKRGKRQQEAEDSTHAPEGRSWERQAWHRACCAFGMATLMEGYGPAVGQRVRGQRDNRDLGEGSPSIHTCTLPQRPVGEGRSKLVCPTKNLVLPLEKKTQKITKPNPNPAQEVFQALEQLRGLLRARSLHSQFTRLWPCSPRAPALSGGCCPGLARHWGVWASGCWGSGGLAARRAGWGGFSRSALPRDRCEGDGDRGGADGRVEDGREQTRP